jgi:monooxygenase
LQANCPIKTYAILEGRDCIGGTWDLFRYPGVRSDSDMHTLGYSFRPWKEEKSLADGPSILKYVKDTAHDDGIDRHIRFSHRVTHAAWSTQDAKWTVEADCNGVIKRITCNFLFMCSGYYRYAAGYTPDFPGTEKFKGRIVHPQKWTSDIDYANKRVVVIGSGATAVTLVPAMTDKAAHVTMLQRSPTYIVSLPGKDRIANFLRSVLPSAVAYGITRWKNVLLGMIMYKMCKVKPQWIKSMVLKGVRKERDQFW